jgi:hypothetical protein
MTDAAERYVDRALEHLRHLAVDIGPRPPTQEGERRAAEYSADVMRAAGLHDVRLESFRSGRSTYWPYSLAVGAGLLGNLLYLWKPGRLGAFVATLLNALGAQGFYAEANFEDNWMRRLLPTGSSQNAVGVIPPAGECRQRVVLLGHLDTHRTPIFYSSPVWLRLFSTLVGAAFASLILSGLAAGLNFLAGHSRPSRIGQLGMAFEAFALAMTLQAETTPYTAGANDNASGAATVLALGERLAQEPLQHTEVWVVNNGCEELGCYGMAALLDAHGPALRDACVLDFDIVGVGQPALLTREGLVRSYRPDPALLELARQVAARHPNLIAGEHAGGAYTDVGVVIKRGFRGLVIDSQLPAGHPAAGAMGYWHQPHDTFDKIERECLAKAQAFGWALLQHIDERA